MIGDIDAHIEEDYHGDLWKSRGEKLVNCERFFHEQAKDSSGPSERIILTFEDSDQIDIENTYKVSVTANNLELGVCDSFNNPISINNIIGKRLLDYGEIQFDAFNIDGIRDILRTTLVFEENFEITVEGYNLLIEKYIEN